MLNYSLHMILCVEDDGVVKPATKENRFDWPVCYTVLL